MMETEKLRKADVFSGCAIVFLGIFIVSRALQMPMKDSYGGVQNVWYVSPALFPLLVGGMLILLGALLIKSGLRTIGLAGLQSTFRYLFSGDLLVFLKRPESIRFYGIVLNLLIFVFLLVPRVDFFLAAIAFLLVFFCMFYCTDQDYLLRLIQGVLGSACLLAAFQLTSAAEVVGTYVPFPADIVVILMIAGLIFAVAKVTRTTPESARKFKLSLVIGISAPFIIGILFKFFLLVPMPFEGLVSSLLDALWYAEFWS